MIANLTLLFLAIAKTALLTGLGPAIAGAVLYEFFGVRILRVGFEKVSARTVSQSQALALSNGNKPARNFARCA